MTKQNCTEQLEELAQMRGSQLRTTWKKLFASEPPAFNRGYFLRRLSYRVQEIAYQTDARPLERKLETHARQFMDLKGNVIKKPQTSHNRPVAGTRLIREHDGETHEVTVLHHGFDYRGKRYKSLTAIAKVITGTQWSGPLFFGLKRNGGKS